MNSPAAKSQPSRPLRRESAPAIGRERRFDIKTIRGTRCSSRDGSAFGHSSRRAPRPSRLDESSWTSRMLQPPSHGLPSSDSIEGLLADWNLEGARSRAPSSGSARFAARTAERSPLSLRYDFQPPSAAERSLRAGESLEFLHDFSLGDPDDPGGRFPSAAPDGAHHPPSGTAGRILGKKPLGLGNTGRRTGVAASGRTPSSQELPVPAICWQDSASSTNWGVGPSRGCIWPRRSIWAGGWWRSRSRAPRGTSRGSSPGCSIRTSCRSIRCATTDVGPSRALHAVLRGCQPSLRCSTPPAA